MELNFSLLISTIILVGSIIIVNPEINIGSIKEGNKQEIVFKVKNVSNKPIKVYSVTSTCGCTIPKFPDVLIPNSTTKIKAVFDSKGMKGKIRKELVLIVSDSVKYYKLSFYADVK